MELQRGLVMIHFYLFSKLSTPYLVDERPTSLIQSSIFLRAQQYDVESFYSDADYLFRLEEQEDFRFLHGTEAASFATW
jgi:hypothetical protein